MHTSIHSITVFYKDGTPNLFDGDIAAEEEVLDWLIEMNVENHIELITRPMLENMVEEIQYLAVYFCKYIFSTYLQKIPNFRSFKIRGFFRCNFPLTDVGRLRDKHKLTM